MRTFGYRNAPQWPIATGHYEHAWEDSVLRIAKIKSLWSTDCGPWSLCFEDTKSEGSAFSALFSAPFSGSDFVPDLTLLVFLPLCAVHNGLATCAGGCFYEH